MNQCNSGQHIVGPPGQAFKHAARILGVFWFGEDVLIDDNDRICSEHNSILAISRSARHNLSLTERKARNVIARCLAIQSPLVNICRHNDEIVAGTCQEFATTW